MNRARGKLKNWNAGKGYGFIRPDDGGKDVFVHIKDIGATARPPRQGDVIQYQVMSDGTGRARAGDIEIEGLPRLPRQRMPTRAPRNAGRHGGRQSRVGWGVVVLPIVAVIGLYAHRTEPVKEFFVSPTVESQPISQARDNYRCEGKQRCFEMTSCNEAKFYIRNCPDTKMDGDGDGVPCEDQLCGH
jgi:cold shock CspA family protein